MKTRKSYSKEHRHSRIKFVTPELRILLNVNAYSGAS